MTGIKPQSTPTPRVFHTTFMRGVRGTDGMLLDGVPQIVFIGRSNAGKSSTINMLLGSEVARTSAMPGKTVEINIFDVREKDGGHFRVLDLPGYGFSRVREKERERLRKMIIWYLTESGAKPRAIALVMDATVPPSPFDIEAAKLAGEFKYPVVVIANKSDKLNQKERHASLKAITEAFPGSTVVPFSAKKGEGKEEATTLLFGKR